MKVRRFNGKTVYEFKTTWIYAEDLIAVLAVVVIFLLGFIMVQLGREMDAEVERQHQAELIGIEHDKIVNQEVTH